MILNCFTLFSIVRDSKNVQEIPRDVYNKFLNAAGHNDDLTIMQLYPEIRKTLLEEERVKFQEEFLKQWIENPQPKL